MAITYPYDAFANSWANADPQLDDHPLIHNNAADAHNVMRTGPRFAYEAAAGALVLTTNHGLAVYTGTGGDTFTLPAASTVARHQIVISNEGSGDLTVSRAGADTIGVAPSAGARTSFTLRPGCCVTMIADGTSVWYAIASKDFVDDRWDDLRAGPSFDWTAAASAPAWAAYNGSSVLRPQFTAGDNVPGSVQLPHGWTGGDIVPHIHWKPSANIAAGSLTWRLIYFWANPATGSTDSGPTTIDAVYNGTDNAWETVTSDWAAVSLTGGTISALLWFQLFLQANTTGQNPFLIDMDFHFQRNRPGTINPATEP